MKNASNPNFCAKPLQSFLWGWPAKNTGTVNNIAYDSFLGTSDKDPRSIAKRKRKLPSGSSTKTSKDVWVISENPEGNSLFQFYLSLRTFEYKKGHIL